MNWRDFYVLYYFKTDHRKNREAYLAMYDKSHLLVQLDQLIDWQSILKS